MNRNLLIPISKHDFEAVERIKKADIESIRPIISNLFEWVEDINWPIAPELARTLVKFDNLIIPFVKDLIQNPDGLREYSVYYYMLPLFTDEQLLLIKNELERVVNNPSPLEVELEYSETILEYI